MLARRILGSGQTRGVSFRPFPNSSGWWWLTSSVFLIRISSHKTTHANSYYGAWPGWAVSISVLPLTGAGVEGGTGESVPSEQGHLALRSTLVLESQLCHMACSLGFYGDGISFLVVLNQSF